MTTLGPSSDITGASTTNAQAKAWFSMIRTFIADLLGTDSANNAAALAAMKVPLNGSLPKSGAYTVVAGDRGKVIKCSGTFTVSLTAAATLGDGFVFAVWNTGSGTITIDPNISELIDGATTKTIAAGKHALVYCDGTAFSVIGAIATGSGSGLDADLLDGQHGSYYAPATGGNYVAKDHGHNVVGSLCFAKHSGLSISAGQTTAGSALQPSCSDASKQSGFLSGTWRCLGYMDGSGPLATLFQRIV